MIFPDRMMFGAIGTWSLLLVALPVSRVSAQQAPAPAATALDVRYEAGKGLRAATADGNNALTLAGRIQGRYTATDRDSGSDRSNFSVRRARLSVSGHVYNPNFRYGFQGDFADDFSLRDAFFESTHVPWATAKAGQFKIPYNRSQVGSSAAMQFVERALTNDEFILGDDGRDIGLSVGGEALPGTLAYSAGVFNGTGPNTSNSDTDHLILGRLLYTPLGAFADYYQEGDLLAAPTPRLGIGIAAAFSSDESNGRTTTRAGLTNDELFPDFTGADIYGTTVDANFKLHGFAALADVYFRRIDPKGSAIDAFDAYGALVQAGYFVVPQRVEVAVRYAWIDPNRSTSANDVRECGGAVGYFFRGHDLKVQADLRHVATERPGRSTADDIEARVQVQAIF